MKDRRQKLTDLVVDRYVNLELFYEKQEPQANGCINWTGVTNNIGYGFIGYREVDPATGAPMKESWDNRKHGMMTTHRLAFMIEHRRLPAYRNVNHTCHNKLCVNPAHLQEGTQQDKLAAMRQVGLTGGAILGVTRGSYLHKQEKRTYKYSDEDIQWIRTAQLDDIAKRFGITRLKAARKQWAFRRGYCWLPCPPFEQRKRGPKKAVNK